MAHWPRTIGGNIAAIVLLFVGGFVVVESAIALSGPFIWVSLAAVSLVGAFVYVRRHRALAARDLAVADAPSFGDVLRERKARDVRDLETS